MIDDLNLLLTDPHGIIPLGWKHKEEYEVVGFLGLGSRAVLEMMVAIQYPGYVPNAWGYSTTRYYITVLQDYLKTVDFLTLQAAMDVWRTSALRMAADEHPEWTFLQVYKK